MGIEDDDQGGRSLENERFAANVTGIAAILEDDFPSFEQVRASPVIGRLTERAIYFIDEERARRMADGFSDVEFAERAGMPSSSSSLQAIGSHQNERFTDNVFVVTLRKKLGLTLLPSSNNSMGRAASSGDCLFAAIVSTDTTDILDDAVGILLPLCILI